MSPVNNTKGKVRIDRFLWATRNFKTRSLSTDACKRNWITINNTTAKASREIKMGDTIKIKQPSHLKTFKVIQLLDKRIGAKLVKCYIEDLTPEEEYEKERVFRKNRKLYSISSSARGRPSKKQRRDLEEFLGQANETDS
ncbi:MAG: RNA-binding S4 domain-containing protein [Opitutae bacterium]|nr:RNA-binding S4 domain-containing protein [Opitutae bacterium]